MAFGCACAPGPVAPSSLPAGARVATSSPPDRGSAVVGVLPAVNRMRNGSDFTAAVRGGRRAGRPSLVVHLSRPEQLEPPRVGFVVSKAVGNAVVRNRVKRRLRHLARERVASLPAGALVVVRASPPSAGAGDLAGDLDRALARLLRPDDRRGRS